MTNFLMYIFYTTIHYIQGNKIKNSLLKYSYFDTIFRYLEKIQIIL